MKPLLDRPRILKAALLPYDRAVAADALPRLANLLQLERQHIQEMQQLKRQHLQRLRLQRKKLLRSMQRRHARLLENTRHTLEQSNRLLIQSALEDAKRDVLELSIKIANTILQTEVSSYTRSLYARMRAVLSELDLSRPEDPRLVRIEVSNQDYQELCHEASTCGALPRLCADASVEKGTARVCMIDGEIIIDWCADFKKLASSLRATLQASQNAREAQ